MGNQRSTGIGLVIISLGGLWSLVFMGVLSGYLPALFFWGIPVGIILGVGTSIYLFSTWNPERLEPKGNRKKATNRVLWVVPLGILLARILPDLIGKELSALLAGTVITWASWSLGYLALQAHRHRPK